MEMAAYLVTAVLVEGQSLRQVAKDPTECPRPGSMNSWPVIGPRARLAWFLVRNVRTAGPPRWLTASRTRSSGSESN
jgi:hypothetical protein